MDFRLTPKQIEGIRARFAATVDLKKEYVAAREYVEKIHAGRPYKNLGKFFWNWCRRVEEQAARRGAAPSRGRAATAAQIAGICSACGCLRQAARAPLASSPTQCGWCGHIEMSRLDDEGVA